MATLIWTGASSGNFGTAGNWIVESTGLTPGSPPANSDVLKFDRGIVDVDAGLSTGLTGVTIIGTPGYAGRIAPGSSLSIACASLRWQAGDLNLGGNITFGIVACRAGSKFNYASGTADDLFIKCDASIAASAVVTELRAMGSYTIDDIAGTAYTLAKLTKGARLKSYRGGVLDIGQSCRATLYAAAPCGTGSNIRSFGLLDYRSAADFAGTVDVEPDGYLDLGNSNKAITIPTLNRWEGSRVNLYTQNGLATVSASVIYGVNPDGMVTGEGGAIPL